MSTYALAMKLTVEGKEPSHTFLGYHLSEEDCDLLEERTDKKFADFENVVEKRYLRMPMKVAQQALDATGEGWLPQWNVKGAFSIQTFMLEKVRELLELTHHVDIVGQYVAFAENSGQEEALGPRLERMVREAGENLKILSAASNFLGAINNTKKYKELPN